MTLELHQIIDIKNKDSLFRNDVGHAINTYIGKTSDVAYSLFTVKSKSLFWVRYTSQVGKDIVEKYTVLNGELAVEYEGRKFVVNAGECIDASEYSQLLSFYVEDEMDILIEMTTEIYDENFNDTEVIQRDAKEIEKVDGYTYLHSARIKDYSIELWKRLGQPVERSGMLRWGAYFHDIGKLAVPLEILNKEEKLTVDEWEIMKAHTTKGAEMIRNHEIEWLRDSAFIIEQHHERYDGKGYPFGLKGDEISIEASIVSVVDSFDAMTTDRVYRKALTIEQAVEELVNGRGTQFHPQVVDEFIKLLQEKQFKWE